MLSFVPELLAGTAERGADALIAVTLLVLLGRAIRSSLTDVCLCVCVYLIAITPAAVFFQNEAPINASLRTNWMWLLVLLAVQHDLLWTSFAASAVVALRSPVTGVCVCVCTLTLAATRTLGSMGWVACRTKQRPVEAVDARNAPRWRSDLGIAASILLAFSVALAAGLDALRGVLGCATTQPLTCVLSRLRAGTVNTGTWWPDTQWHWYLLSLAFTRYIPYFTAISWGHPLLYPLPVALRLSFRPLVACAVVLGVTSVLDPSEAYSPMFLPLMLAVMCLMRDIVDEMKNKYLWLGLVCLATISFPAMKHAWLVRRTGNANLMFNMQLGFAVACGCGIAEFAAATLRLHKQEKRNKAAQLAAAVHDKTE